MGIAYAPMECCYANMGNGNWECDMEIGKVLVGLEQWNLKRENLKVRIAVRMLINSGPALWKCYTVTLIGI